MPLTALGPIGVLVCIHAVVAAEPASSLTTAEVQSRIREVQGRISSFRAVYEFRGYGPEYQRGTYLHREIAAKSPGCFYHLSAHGFDKLDWHDDPLMVRTAISGNYKITENPVNRVYRESRLEPSSGLPGTLSQDFFLVWSGLWPLSDIKPLPYEGIAFPLSVVASDEAYAVEPIQDQVDGRWCHVLSNEAGDRLWLDVSGRCALMARELRKPMTGIVFQRVVMSDHLEVESGVWVPRRFANTIFDATLAANRDTGRVGKTTILQVTSLSVNDVSDELFIIEKRAGAVVEEDNSDIARQEVGGGIDHIDSLVDWIDKHCEKSGTVEAASNWRYVAEGALAACALIMCSYVVWRTKIMQLC